MVLEGSTGSNPFNIQKGMWAVVGDGPEMGVGWTKKMGGLLVFVIWIVFLGFNNKGPFVLLTKKPQGPNLQSSES